MTEYCDCCDSQLDSDDPVLCAYCVEQCLDDEDRDALEAYFCEVNA